MFDNILIVLNYNDAEATVKFINNAKLCNAIHKIIVVDNCSTDDSFQILSNHCSEKVDVILSDRNGGYAYGNNFGVQYAIKNYNPEICFISNPDVTFENTTIIEMANCLKQNKKIAIVAPVVNQGYNIWNLPGFIGVIESLFLIWHNIHKYIIKKRILSVPNKLIKVGVVEGSFFAISVQAYKEIKGFDERTFLYYEENILAQRVYFYNYEICVLTDCRYNHFHSVSIKKCYKSKANAFKLFYPSMLLYLTEYLHINKVQIMFFKFLFKMAYCERKIYDFIKNV